MNAGRDGDALRPSGTVEVACERPGCGWHFWVDALDPRLPDGPFVCAHCDPDAHGSACADALTALWEDEYE